MGLMTSCYRVDVPNGPMGQSIVKSLVKVGKGVICGTSYGIAVGVGVIRVYGFGRVIQKMDCSLRAEQRIPLFNSC